MPASTATPVQRSAGHRMAAVTTTRPPAAIASDSVSNPGTASGNEAGSAARLRRKIVTARPARMAPPAPAVTGSSYQANWRGKRPR